MEAVPFYLWVVLLLAGVLTGYVNTIAGGGSFLTIPLLIAMGLPPTVANATNRLSVFLQCISAVGAFRKLKVFPLKFALLASIPAVLASIWGARIAATMQEGNFTKILALFMVVMTLLSLLNPAKGVAVTDVRWSAGRVALVGLLFALIGLYGGFLQAGVGFLIIAAMVFTGYDLVTVNAVKSFVIMVFTAVSLVVFITSGKVVWLHGLVLSSGSIIGAQLGAHATVKRGAVFIKRFVMVAVIICAVLLVIKG